MEGLAGELGGRFFLVEQALEATQLLLHLRVDFQITSDDDLHLVHIVVDITVFGFLALDVLNQLTLLRDHVRYFLKVLEVVHAELLLLLHDIVDLLVESDQIIVGHGLAICVPQRHPQVVQLGLSLLRIVTVGPR